MRHRHLFGRRCKNCPQHFCLASSPIGVNCASCTMDSDFQHRGTDQCPCHALWYACASCTMDSEFQHRGTDQCPCRALWYASYAHSWGVKKSRADFHGRGCRCRFCWRNLTGFCAWKERGQCTAHRLHVPSPAAGSVFSEAEDGVPGKTVERRYRFRYCYVCSFRSYIGKGQCINVACPRASLGWQE